MADQGMSYDPRSLFANPPGQPLPRGTEPDPNQPDWGLPNEGRQHVAVGSVLKVKPTGDMMGMTPDRAYPDDAGLDLFVSKRTVIPCGQFVDVSSGIAVELPPGTWGLIQGRSSTLRKRQLLVNPGVIDVGYRGELFAGCWNLGRVTQILEPGERVAQLIIIANVTEMVGVRVVDELGEHARGGNGFGSSGR